MFSQGEEQQLPGGAIERHRHVAAYAAVVLEGGYIESGDSGRWPAGPGDVLAHGAFEAHLNEVRREGARVINIPLPQVLTWPAMFRVCDPDALIRAARFEQRDAWRLLVPMTTAMPHGDDWPALLATAIRLKPTLMIGSWAADAGLSPATVSRGFRAAFGTTPARYRAEARARMAWRQIVVGDEPLAGVSYDCGFADQAHLSRAVRMLTGFAPSAWRRVKLVQDRQGDTAEDPQHAKTLEDKALAGTGCDCAVQCAPVAASRRSLREHAVGDASDVGSSRRDVEWRWDPSAEDAGRHTKRRPGSHR